MRGLLEGGRRVAVSGTGEDRNFPLAAVDPLNPIPNILGLERQNTHPEGAWMASESFRIRPPMASKTVAIL